MYEESMDSAIFVANMFAQDGIRAVLGQHPLKYDALEKCMKYVADFILINHLNLRIIAPRFGSGLAGADWRIIEAMINVYWIDKGIDVTIFSLE
jgi:hypothetical protein